MKKLVLVLLLSTSTVYGAEVTIINHFSEPLNYYLHLNPDTLPDLPEQFSLAIGERIKSRVVSSEECYIRVQPDKETPHKSAFWGIDAKRGVRGYIGEGIAYSWNHGPRYVVTFCTPDEYAQNGHC